MQYRQAAELEYDIPKKGGLQAVLCFTIKYASRHFDLL